MQPHDRRRKARAVNDGWVAAVPCIGSAQMKLNHHRPREGNGHIFASEFGFAVKEYCEAE